MGQGTIGYRWTGEREVTIGYSSGTPAEVRTEAVSVMEELTGTSAAETLLPPLAGSNNFIQLIDDDTTWQALHSFVEIVVGTHCAAAADATGEEHWRDRKKVSAAIEASVSTPLKRLAQFVSKCVKTGTTVIAARPISLAGHVRNVGVELASDDPADIAWKISHLGEFGFTVGLAEPRAPSISAAIRALNGSPTPSSGLRLLTTVAWSCLDCRSMGKRGVGRLRPGDGDDFGEGRGVVATRALQTASRAAMDLHAVAISGPPGAHLNRIHRISSVPNRTLATPSRLA